MTTTPEQRTRLKAAAEAATPGNLDSVPSPSDEYGGREEGHFECPCCQGNGEVEGVDYCNFDGVAMGVQLYGIGNEFGNYERFFRAANPETILALLAEIESLEARVASAEGALEPFACESIRFDDSLASHGFAFSGSPLKIAAFRAARAHFQSQGGDHGK